MLVCGALAHPRTTSTRTLARVVTPSSHLQCEKRWSINGSWVTTAKRHFDHSGKCTTVSGLSQDACNREADQLSVHDEAAERGAWMKRKFDQMQQGMQN